MPSDVKQEEEAAAAGAPPPEEEEEEEDDDEELEDEEDDEELEDDLNFSSPITIADPKLSSSIIETPPTLIDQKPQLTPEKKPTSASEESRKLFQRLWTDEDEIGLLQGYLDFTTQRGGNHNSSYHHDTGPFYDQIKTRLQLDFNKNQLVEKLRRLKKKYRNVVSRISSGKEVSFKTPHDQASYEISRKIWNDGAVGIDEDEGNPNPLNSYVNIEVKPSFGNLEKKVSGTPKQRSQKRAAENELPNLPKFRADSSTTNAIEDTVRSCLSPLFKELISCATNGPCNFGGLGGGVALNPMPLSFGGKSLLNFGSGGEKLDERWRKQQILELEVYSKRIELVQDQIKSALEDLRSMDK